MAESANPALIAKARRAAAWWNLNHGAGARVSEISGPYWQFDCSEAWNSPRVMIAKAEDKEWKDPKGPDSLPLWSSIESLMILCHLRSVQAGWHDRPVEKGTQIALIHEELSEALRGVRTGSQDKHLPHRLSEEVEMADAVMRICDYCGAHGLDLAFAIMEKLEYNLHREDHKREEREKEGGKKF